MSVEGPSSTSWLLVEQELDSRPEIARAVERLVRTRAGRRYWRSGHDHLYAIDLSDSGRGFRRAPPSSGSGIATSLGLPSTRSTLIWPLSGCSWAECAPELDAG